MKLFVPMIDQCELVTQYRETITPFIEYNINRPGYEFVHSPEAADIIVIFEEWSFKLWNYAETLLNSKLIQTFSNKIYTINYDDYGRGFLPGCYTSLTLKNINHDIHRACAYPNTYNQYTQDFFSARHYSEPKLLFSFRGTLSSNPIRKKIFKLFRSHKNVSVVSVEKAFHSHIKEEKKDYVEEILSSKFVLCPRGWSPSTYRLFEVMSLGRCPVIISDEWVPIAGIDWDNCSIQIREKNITSIADILNTHAHRAKILGDNARSVWLKHFSKEKKYQDYLDKLVDIHGGIKERRNKFEDFSARWHSFQFYYSNGWTIPQRMINKLWRYIYAIN